MNHFTQRIHRSAFMTAVLLLVSVLVLSCTMVLGVAAEGTGETYTLKLEATLYDEIGDEWPVGIQTELAEGAEIDTDALTEKLFAQYPYLADSVLSDEGFIGLPSDGKMPAEDLTISATFEIRPFAITWIVDGTEIIEQVAYGAIPAFNGIPEKAADAQYSYTFSGWDAEPVEAYGNATYTAQFDATVNEYTVTWNVDGTETSVTLPYGATPVFEGSTEKAADVQYTYTFTGWDKEVTAVAGDVTYTAQFDATVNEYTVTWIVDGTEITDKVEYGTVPAFNGTPAKDADAQYTYTFKGWDKTPVAVTGDATYTAVFEATANEITITFKVDGQADVTVTVKAGETPAYPNGTPTKAADAQYTYTFKGWDKEITAATENTVYTAQFNGTVRKYNVYFYYGHNTVLPTVVEYGQSAKAPTDTDKAPTESTVYEFTGWDVDFSNITGDLKVYAQYTETVRTYTVTFNYGDGKSETVTVEYGKGATAPTDTDKAADAEYTYTFKGWDADFSAVSSDMTVNAQYEQIPVKEPETTDEPTTDEPTTDEPTTNEPTTNEPTTNEPTTTEPIVTDPETTPDTAIPGGETETDPTTGDGCNGTWWWIVLVIVVVAGVAVAVIILLRRKGKPEGDEPAAAPVADPEPEPAPAPAPEAPAETAPLFVPVGEEIPEEEIPTEVETVEEVHADTVDDMMTDKVAEHFLVTSDEEGGTGKMGIINVGLISAAYQAGDTVDLASLQEKGMIDANVGRLKVLASGTLDKPLIIKADAFSVQAVKMITLTGGQAIELKSE